MNSRRLYTQQHCKSGFRMSKKRVEELYHRQTPVAAKTSRRGGSADRGLKPAIAKGQPKSVNKNEKGGRTT